MDEQGERDAAREAFSLLAHDIRLDILRTFFDHWQSVHTETASEADKQLALTYSELMDAVDMQDSGKFNYHLEKLRGIYVEKVANGYAPTASATALYRAVIANQPTSQTSIDVETNCPACNTTVNARYEQEYLVIDCDHCEQWRGLIYPFPKNGLEDRTGTDVLDAVATRSRFHIGLAQTGQCPDCAGTVRTEYHRDTLDGEQTPTVELCCTTCSWVVNIDIVTPLTFVPEVVTALLALDVYDTDMGDVDETFTSVSGRVTDEDPLRVTVTIEANDDAVAVVLDETLSVVTVDC